VSLVRSAKRILARSKLIALVVLVAAVFFTAGFVELTMARRQLEARHQQAQERVETLRRQNTLLQVELNRAQQGESLPWQAWEMYGKVPKGAGVMQVAPVQTGAKTIDKPKTPIWADWLKALGIN